MADDQNPITGDQARVHADAQKAALELEEALAGGGSDSSSEQIATPYIQTPATPPATENTNVSKPGFETLPNQAGPAKAPLHVPVDQIPTRSQAPQTNAPAQTPAAESALSSLAGISEADLKKPLVGPAAVAAVTPVPIPKPAQRGPVTALVTPAPNATPAITAREKTVRIGPTTTLPPIRTLEGDMVGAIRSQHSSLSSIALGAMEARRQGTQDKVTKVVDKSVKRGKLFLVAAALFFVIALAGTVYILFFRSSEEAPASPVNPAQTSLVRTEEKVTFDLTGVATHVAYDTVKSHLAKNDLTLGIFQQLLFGTRVAQETSLTLLDTRSFFEAMGLPISDLMARSLQPLYTFGVHTHHSNNGFMVLEPDSFQVIFAEMLAWEPTIARDLYPLLSGKEAPTDITNHPNIPGRAKAWQDRIINNIDTRVLTDSSGTIRMIYGFLPAKELLVITISPDTFLEVVTRIQTPGTISR